MEKVGQAKTAEEIAIGKMQKAWHKAIQELAADATPMSFVEFSKTYVEEVKTAKVRTAVELDAEKLATLELLGWTLVEYDKKTGRNIGKTGTYLSNSNAKVYGTGFLNMDSIEGLKVAREHMQANIDAIDVMFS